MQERVVVFLDYQNVYNGARRAFHDDQLQRPPHWCGQIDPWKLGSLIVDRSPYDRVLQEVRVYRGRPDSTREPKGYAACTRQVDIWAQNPGIKPTVRTLRYPMNWPSEKAQEKGIDVALALDFLAMAIRSEYEVGIIMSTDTDMKPALEQVIDLRTRLGAITPRAEVAAWKHDEGFSRRLSVPGVGWCHWLGRADYDKVSDETDYSREV